MSYYDASSDGLTSNAKAWFNHRMNTATCTRCNTERPIREIMGGTYYVLGFCGHVITIRNDKRI